MYVTHFLFLSFSITFILLFALQFLNYSSFFTSFLFSFPRSFTSLLPHSSHHFSSLNNNVFARPTLSHSHPFPFLISYHSLMHFVLRVNPLFLLPSSPESLPIPLVVLILVTTMPNTEHVLLFSTLPSCLLNNNNEK